MKPTAPFKIYLTKQQSKDKGFIHFILVVYI